MKIKLSKSQWKEMGRKAGWIKTSNFKVIDNEFNRDNYAGLVGRIFEVPPAYANVIETSEPASYKDIEEFRKIEQIMKEFSEVSHKFRENLLSKEGLELRLKELIERMYAAKGTQPDPDGG